MPVRRGKVDFRMSEAISDQGRGLEAKPFGIELAKVNGKAGTRPPIDTHRVAAYAPLIRVDATLTEHWG
jgi:hypothetical protein